MNQEPFSTSPPMFSTGTITDGGEHTHSYAVESNNEVKMTKQEIISMIHRAGFEAVETDTVYNRVMHA